MYRAVRTILGPLSVNVSFVWQTISSLLDWKLQTWKEIKAVWPRRLLSLVLYVWGGEREREGGYHSKVLCLCANGRSRGDACPPMRTCVVFHISRPAPMGSSLVQRRALAFQIRCTIPFDNEERESNMCCCARLGQWGVGLGLIGGWVSRTCSELESLLHFFKKGETQKDRFATNSQWWE